MMICYEMKEILIRLPSLDSKEIPGVASSIAGGVHIVGGAGKCLCTLIFLIILVYFFQFTILDKLYTEKGLTWNGKEIMQRWPK